MNIRVSDVLGTPQEQLADLLSNFTGFAPDSSVRNTYPIILGLRCPRCGSAGGNRCRTESGKITYPHTARIQDAVAFVAHLIRVESRVAEWKAKRTDEGGTG